MGDLGWPELLIIVLLVLILFGGRKIPEVARNLGEGIRSFKSALQGGEPPGSDTKGSDRKGDRPQ